MPNYYQVLEVAENASRAKLKSAYRLMAMRWHPDRHPHQPQVVEERFKEIVRAYKVLSDPLERRSYDQSLQAQRQANQSGQASQSSHNSESGNGTASAGAAHDSHQYSHRANPESFVFNEPKNFNQSGQTGASGRRRRNQANAAKTSHTEPASTVRHRWMRLFLPITIASALLFGLVLAIAFHDFNQDDFEFAPSNKVLLAADPGQSAHKVSSESLVGQSLPNHQAVSPPSLKADDNRLYLDSHLSIEPACREAFIAGPVSYSVCLEHLPRNP